MKKVDLTDVRFGRLVVVRKTEEKKNGSCLWECRCDCGNVVQRTAALLNTGRYKSCGCKEYNPVKYPYKGELLTVKEFAALVGHSKSYIYHRLREGDSLQDIADGVTKFHQCYVDTRKITLSQLAEEIGITHQAMSKRFKKGLRGDELLKPKYRTRRMTKRE